MVPCCLKVISCEEHEEQLKQGPITRPGGAIGIAEHCPKNAIDANVLVKAFDLAETTKPRGKFRIK